MLKAEAPLKTFFPEPPSTEFRLLGLPPSTLTSPFPWGNGLGPAPPPAVAAPPPPAAAALPGGFEAFGPADPASPASLEPDFAAFRESIDFPGGSDALVLWRIVALTTPPLPFTSPSETSSPPRPLAPIPDSSLIFFVSGSSSTSSSMAAGAAFDSSGASDAPSATGAGLIFAADLSSGSRARFSPGTAFEVGSGALSPAPACESSTAI
mmetsp:Transcript_15187/g.37234  ORF Transcript_15187/g.37234 Transcript_15187/m.37234 type:complete len:209 (+) Transcript_15187:1471-2097(+)